MTETGGTARRPAKQDLRHTLAAVARRDRAAFRGLYEATVERVFAIAVAIVGHRQDAEDVTCEVFQQIWRQAGSYDPGRNSVMGWMGVICRSRSLDLLRRRATRRNATAAAALSGPLTEIE